MLGSNMPHTVTLSVQYTVNVNALIKIANKAIANGTKKIVKRKLTTLDVGNLNRSSKTGYGKRRYENADIRFPLLITNKNELLDGRHRLCKLSDMGCTYANVVIMDDYEIDQ